ncbi:MAG: protein kinase [Gemmatimonadales bacterium]
MEQDSWSRLEAIFFAALEQPADAREAFLDRACGGDQVLRAEVASVLAAHLEAGGTATPDRLLPAFDPAAPAVAPGSLVGQPIGAYRLDALIGHGGMGEVYRASRADEEYQRNVAIKLMRPGRDSAELMRRFRFERQVLARLEHPNIATLLDGGVTPAGQPYLVMQYVDGVPITAFAADRRLSVPNRLRLFATVCDAVQFAHANLIVHRDLKPSNILVTSDGQPRLLDFGIAKLIDPSDGSSTTGDLLLLTPEHAAPEQFLGSAITTATDVYALGVLLYELLTGSRPFQAVAPVELHRAVCEQEPARPSGVVRDERRRLLAGDLDSIVLMALRKEPGRRYASAGQFAEDVRRHLDGQPVLARPDSLSYRIGKFVGRNAVGVAAASAGALLLMGTAGYASWQAHQRAVALATAEAERTKATRITDFLIGVFNSTDPSEANGRVVTARELLDRAASDVQRDLADEPLVRADLDLAIGRAYQALGLSRSATPHFERALTTQQAAAGDRRLARAVGLEWLARNRSATGASREALTLVEEALAIRDSVRSPDSVAMVPALLLQASLRRPFDNYDTSGVALRAFDRALAIARSANPPDYEWIATTLKNRATLLLDQEKGDEAVAAYREAVEAGRIAKGDDHPFLFNLYESLALGLQAVGHRDSAIAIHRRLLAERRRVFGPVHGDVAFSLYNLARELGRDKQFDESLPLFRQAVEMREQLFGPDHYLVAYALHSYAVATAQSGDLAGAAPLFRRAAQVGHAALGDGVITVQDSWEGLAIVETMLGHAGPAVDALEQRSGRGTPGFAGWARLRSPA